MESPLSDDPHAEHYDFDSLINDEVKIHTDLSDIDVELIDDFNFSIRIHWCYPKCWPILIIQRLMIYLLVLNFLSNTVKIQHKTLYDFF